MYTSQQVCDLLGIAKSTLFRWEKEGRLPKPSRTLTGNRKYSVSEIKVLLKCLTQQQQMQAISAIERHINKHIAETEKLSELLKTLAK